MAPIDVSISHSAQAAVKKFAISLQLDTVIGTHIGFF